MTFFFGSYNRGAIPGSINIPYATSFAQYGTLLLPSTEATILHANKGKIIVVVGNRGDSAVKVCCQVLLHASNRLMVGQKIFGSKVFVSICFSFLNIFCKKDSAGFVFFTEESTFFVPPIF